MSQLPALRPLEGSDDVIRNDPTDQSILLVVQGVLDYASAPDLRAAISAAVANQPTPLQLMVDLRRVKRIDETGIGTLVVSTRICRQLGIDFTVRRSRRVFSPAWPAAIAALGSDLAPSQSMSDR